MTYFDKKADEVLAALGSDARNGLSLSSWLYLQGIEGRMPRTCFAGQVGPGHRDFL